MYKRAYDFYVIGGFISGIYVYFLTPHLMFNMLTVYVASYGHIKHVFLMATSQA
jgi:hypothetical protein